MMEIFQNCGYFKPPDLKGSCTNRAGFRGGAPALILGQTLGQTETPHNYRTELKLARPKILIVSLSKDLFERLTSTGSGLFSFLLGGFAQIFGQIVSIIVKRNTIVGASRCFEMKKTTLPVDVHCSASLKNAFA